MTGVVRAAPAGGCSACVYARHLIYVRGCRFCRPRSRTLTPRALCVCQAPLGPSRLARRVCGPRFWSRGVPA